MAGRLREESVVNTMMRTNTTDMADMALPAQGSHSSSKTEIHGLFKDFQGWKSDFSKPKGGSNLGMLAFYKSMGKLNVRKTVNQIIPCWDPWGSMAQTTKAYYNEGNGLWSVTWAVNYLDIGLLPLLSLYMAFYPNSSTILAFYPNSSTIHSFYPNSSTIQAFYPNSSIIQALYPNSSTILAFYLNSSTIQAFYPNSSTIQAFYPNSSTIQAFYPNSSTIPALKYIYSIQGSQDLMGTLLQSWSDKQLDMPPHIKHDRDMPPPPKHDRVLHSSSLQYGLAYTLAKNSHVSLLDRAFLLG